MEEVYVLRKKKDIVPSPVLAEKSLRIFLKVFRVDCVLIKIIYFYFLIC